MDQSPPQNIDIDIANLCHLTDSLHRTWTPFLGKHCSFGPEIFERVMLNFIHNPNLNTSWLFRADILHDSSNTNNAQSSSPDGAQHELPIELDIAGFQKQRVIVRRLIPRNTRRDNPLNQTCFFATAGDSNLTRSIVVYLPHETSEAALPFYHPKVPGIAHVHEWDPHTSSGTVSVHFLLFNHVDAENVKLGRTALQLLSMLHRHGEGQAAGYIKRVHHDVVIPQARFQDKFTQLKLKYAQHLVKSWAEATDPVKHVFEDLGIAAFLIELWADMYSDTNFPGFVDIGCGNGLLVHILRMEGFKGWGFDARERKSWEQYKGPADDAVPEPLKQLILLPDLAPHHDDDTSEGADTNTHNGVFAPGTFIISNHADELTPWTPVLAAASDCPFIMIPCCSHDFTGSKFRAPPPRDKSKGHSTYASLVEWVTHVAEDCGWEVETEMLRIPSTRNSGLVGRRRRRTASQNSDDGGIDAVEVDLAGLVRKYGGASGFSSNALKLAKVIPRGH